MEYSSTTENRPKKITRKVFLTVLLIPVLFGILMWNIGLFAYRHGIFYMPPSYITGTTIVLFALAWLYLVVRLMNLKLASAIALITVIALLFNLFIKTTNATTKYEPVLSISKSFKVPQGWIEAGEAGPYVFFGNLWKKHDESSPLTADDLKQIAFENNIKNYRLMGNCDRDIDVFGCSLYGGEINGQKVKLKYFESLYKGYESTLTFSIEDKDIYPPRPYSLIPYCSEMDLAGDLRMQRVCSPWEVFRFNFF